MIPKRVFVLALTVTLMSGAFSFYVHDRPRVDAKAYDKIGWNLAQGFGYVEEESFALTPHLDDAIVRVGPGYEFFLASIYSVFGHSYPAVWVAHALLRGASVIMLYMLAKILLASEGVAFLAALFFGFSPDILVVNGFLLTETLFLFLLIAATYATLSFFARPRNALLFGAGTLWALAILVRPVALLGLFIVVAVLCARRAWKEVLIVCIGPLVLVGAWSAYATHRYGSFILTTTAGGYDLWVGNNKDATGGFEKTPEIQALRDTMHSVELEKISRKKYFEFLFSSPLAFAELQFRKLAIYANVLRPGGAWIGLYDHRWLLWAVIGASLVGNMIFFGAGIAGLWAIVNQKRDIVTRVFIAIACAAPLGVIPIIVETRYRYTFFPFLAVGAAFFCMQRPINKKLLGMALGVLGVFVLYDFWSNGAFLMQRLLDIV